MSPYFLFYVLRETQSTPNVCVVKDLRIPRSRSIVYTVHYIFHKSKCVMNGVFLRVYRQSIKSTTAELISVSNANTKQKVSHKISFNTIQPS